MILSSEHERTYGGTFFHLVEAAGEFAITGVRNSVIVLGAVSLAVLDRIPRTDGDSDGSCPIERVMQLDQPDWSQELAA